MMKLKISILKWTFFSLLLASNSVSAMILDENCSINILNRTIQVSADGGWTMPNVPSFMGRVRARATCIRDGVTTSGQSNFFNIQTNVITRAGDIVFDDPTPIPVSLQFSNGSNIALTAVANTAQLALNATYADGSVKESLFAQDGVNYISTNPDIVSVSEDGFLTAVNSGSVLITARLEGVIAFKQVSVSLSGDLDQDGLPDDFEAANGLDANDPIDAFEDADKDGLSNLEEFQAGTDVNVADTDGDGIEDGEELIAGENGFVTNALAFDTDGDGVSDGLEVTVGSDPTDFSSINLVDSLDSIAISESDIILTYNTLNNEVSRQLTVTGTLIDGTNINLTETSIGTNYSSSDLDVLSFGVVDGEIFGGQAGTATLTVENSGFTTQAYVTVVNFAPIVKSFISLPSGSRDVETVDDYAYVAAGDAGLVIVDVSDPDLPFIASTIDTPGSAYDVRVDGDYLYLADRSGGLRIYDISAPSAPAFTGAIALDDAQDLSVANGVAYIANGGLTTVDVSDPFAPTVLRIGTGDIIGVDTDGESLVAVGPSKLWVYDIQSDPQLPPILGSIDTSSNANRDVVVRDQYAYVAAYTNGYRVIDIRDPLNMVNSVGENPFFPTDVALTENHAFFSEILFTSASPYVNIQDSTNPVYQGFIDYSAFGDLDGVGIAVDDNFVFMVTSSRLYIGQHSIVEDTAGIAPEVSIAKPLDIDDVFSGLANDFEVNATDDVKVASVRFMVNGEVLGVKSNPPYRVAFTPQVGDTSVTLSAVAFDIAGNQSQVVEKTFDVSEFVLAQNELLLTVESIHAIDNLPVLTKAIPFTEVDTQLKAAREARNLAAAGWALDGTPYDAFATEIARYTLEGDKGDILGFTNSTGIFRELLFHSDNNDNTGLLDLCDTADNFGVISGVNRRDNAIRDCAVENWGRFTLEDSNGIAPEVNLTSPNASVILVGGQEREFIINATDDVLVKSVSMMVDGVLFQEDREAPYAFLYTAPNTGETFVDIEFIAKDFSDREGSTGVLKFDIGIDTDGDGLSDEDETNIHLTDPTKVDTDGDSLSDFYEIIVAGTNPLLVDTDGDGINDDVEIANGYDPLDAADNQVNIENDLVAYLPFEDTTHDATGNGHDADQFGSINYVEGAKGKAVHLATFNDYLGIEQDISLAGDFTISTFIKTDQYAHTIDGPFTGGNYIFSWATAATNFLSTAVSYGDENFAKSGFRVVVNETGSTSQHKVGIVDQWVHVVVRRENGIITRYLNGEKIGGNDFSQGDSLAIEYLVLGGETDCIRGCIEENQALYGALDEFRIYSRAVNLAELEALESEYEPQALQTGQVVLSVESTHAPESLFTISTIVDYSEVDTQRKAAAKAMEVAALNWGLEGTQGNSTSGWSGPLILLDMEAANSEILGYDNQGAAKRYLKFHTDDNTARGSHNICESPDNYGVISGLISGSFLRCAIVNWGRFSIEDTNGIAPSISLISPTPEKVLQTGLSINFSIEATDDVHVEKVEMYVDGLLVQTIEQSPYLFSYTPAIGDTFIDVEFIAADLSNRQTSTGVITFEVALDTDGDGLSDESEINIHGTDINKSDTDDDGITDFDEVQTGIDPLLADTDADGVDDGIEVANGYNPLDASDNQVSLNAGLLAYLPFEDTSHDVTNNGYDADQIGNIQFVNGAKGKAVQLGSFNDYLGIEQDISLSSDFTFSTFVKLDQYANSFGGTGSGENTLFQGWSDSSSNEMLVGLASGTLADQSFHTMLNDQNFNVEYKRGIFDQWLHVVVRRESGVISHYLNGEKLDISDQLMGHALAIEYLTLGVDQDCLRGCFSENEALYGALDEFRIYNRAVNLAELIALQSEYVPQDIVLEPNQVILKIESELASENLNAISKVLDFTEVDTQREAAAKAMELAALNWGLEGIQGNSTNGWSGPLILLDMAADKSELLNYDNQGAVKRYLVFHTDDNTARSGHNICESSDNYGVISGLISGSSLRCAIFDWGRFSVENGNGDILSIGLTAP